MSGSPFCAALTTLVFFRVCFFIAQLCYFMGAYINTYHYGVTNYQYDYQLRTCYRTKSTSYLSKCLMEKESWMLPLLLECHGCWNAMA